MVASTSVMTMIRNTRKLLRQCSSEKTEKTSLARPDIPKAGATMHERATLGAKPAKVTGNDSDGHVVSHRKCWPPSSPALHAVEFSRLQSDMMSVLLG